MSKIDDIRARDANVYQLDQMPPDFNPVVWEAWRDRRWLLEQVDRLREALAAVIAAEWVGPRAQATAFDAANAALAALDELARPNAVDRYHGMEDGTKAERQRTAEAVKGLPCDGAGRNGCCWDASMQAAVLAIVEEQK